MARKNESAGSDKKSLKEPKKKINPDDVGLGKEEADDIIAELDDLSDEEIEKQARETEA